MERAGLKIEDKGHWIYVISEKKHNYTITGKYLFFSENKERLLELAKNEILDHDFHVAKVNNSLLGSNTEYVLCLYYHDDSRKYELAERYRERYSDTKYRYWKSDEDTIKGKYSEEFLSTLNKVDQEYFTTDKTKDQA
jgi:hypothetical protein